MADRRAQLRIQELRDEARYRRERLELYRARRYGGRADPARLAALTREHDGAAARLKRALAEPGKPG